MGYGHDDTDKHSGPEVVEEGMLLSTEARPLLGMLQKMMRMLATTLGQQGRLSATAGELPQAIAMFQEAHNYLRAGRGEIDWLQQLLEEETGEPQGQQGHGSGMHSPMMGHQEAFSWQLGDLVERAELLYGLGKALTGEGMQRWRGHAHPPEVELTRTRKVMTEAIVLYSESAGVMAGDEAADILTDLKVMRCEVLELLKEPALALKDASWAARMEPTQPDIWLKVAALSLQPGVDDPARAIGAATTHLQLRPRSLQGLLLRACAMQRWHRWAAALTDISKAQHLYPWAPLPSLLRARTLAMMPTKQVCDSIDMALRSLADFLSAPPASCEGLPARLERSSVCSWLGRLWEVVGQHERAAVQYEKAVKRDPNPHNLHLLARSDFLRGRPDRVILSLPGALEVMTENYTVPSAANAYNRRDTKVGQAAAAAKPSAMKSETRIRRDRGNTLAADVARRMGRLKEMEGQYLQGRELKLGDDYSKGNKDLNSKCLCLYAQSLFVLGRDVESAENFAAAVKENPSNCLAMSNWAKYRSILLCMNQGHILSLQSNHSVVSEWVMSAQEASMRRQTDDNPYEVTHQTDDQPDEVLDLDSEQAAALTLLDECLAKDRLDVNALLTRAELHSLLGRCGRAIADLDSVIRIDANCMRAMLNRGVLRLLSSKLPPAISDLTRVIEGGMPLERLLALSNRAVAHGTYGRLAQSEEDLTLVLEKLHQSKVLGSVSSNSHFIPHGSTAHVNRALVRTVLGRYKEALEDFDAAADALGVNRATAMRWVPCKRDGQAASNALQTMDGLLGWAFARAGCGDLEQSAMQMSNIMRAAALLPAEVVAMRSSLGALVSRLALQGPTHRPRKHSIQSMSSSMARNSLQSGQVPPTQTKALRHFLHAVHACPTSAVGWLNSTRCLGLMGHGSDALRTAEAASAICPRHVGALRQLGTSLADAGRLDDAQAVLGRAISFCKTPLERPSISIGYTQSAKTHLTFGLGSMSAQASPQALVRCLITVGVIAYRQSNYDKALGHFREALAVLNNGAISCEEDYTSLQRVVHYNLAAMSLMSCRTMDQGAAGLALTEAELCKSWSRHPKWHEEACAAAAHVVAGGRDSSSEARLAIASCMDQAFKEHGDSQAYSLSVAFANLAAVEKRDASLKGLGDRTDGLTAAEAHLTEAVSQVCHDSHRGATPQLLVERGRLRAKLRRPLNDVMSDYVQALLLDKGVRQKWAQQQMVEI
ncbi:unnamed protein product [Chrysoparadoxa australica]